jgi:hypothetical protein
MLALALGLLVQGALLSAIHVAQAEELSALERECVEKLGEGNEAALMQCLGIVDPRFAPVDEVEDAISGQHPSQMLVFAARLFHSEARKDDALFWFYAGQLRWRTQLACTPPEPGGEGAALGAMLATIGPDINQYAASDVDNWLGTIDRVLAWEDANRDLTLGPDCDAARKAQREGLSELAVSIEEQREDFEAATRAREAEASEG